MMNIYFPSEEIEENDLFFICYMIERVARRLHQKNKYIVNAIGEKNFAHLLSTANVSHCENPLSVEDRWIAEYNLQAGCFDITCINPQIASIVPTESQIGKVYQRLILDTTVPNEDYNESILRVYNSCICDIIDNYNSSAFYEPPYIIAKAYEHGSF